MVIMMTKYLYLSYDTERHRYYITEKTRHALGLPKHFENKRLRIGGRLELTEDLQVREGNKYVGNLLYCEDWGDVRRWLKGALLSGTCPKCGSGLYGSIARFCPECGAEVEKYFDGIVKEFVKEVKRWK